MKTVNVCVRSVLFAIYLIFSTTLAFHVNDAKAEPPMLYGVCDSDRERSGLSCYNKCKPGYSGFLASCLTTCPPGFVDIGLVCTDINTFAKESYGRGAGIPMGCKPGQWQNGLLCYENCQNGFYGVGPVCWEHCPPGTDTDWGLFCVRYPKIVGWGPCWWFICLPQIDWGFMHWKSSYGRGWGVPLNHCKPGTHQSGMLCYPNCKDGFVGAGPVCWQVCPHTHKDAGALCHRDNGFFKAHYFRDIGVPIHVNTCPNYPKKTHYPIVLVHGWSGFDSLKWFGDSNHVIFEYFGNVAPELRKGGASVFTPPIQMVGSTETRGEELHRRIQEILKETGKNRVHLIGHSHGATTARYVAGTYPSEVASVTSVSGVNYSPQLIPFIEEFAAWEQRNVEFKHNWVLWIFDNYAQLVQWAAYHDKSKYPYSHEPIYKSMSTKGMTVFNWKHPWGLPSLTKGQGSDWPSPLGYVRAMTQEQKDKLKEIKETGENGNQIIYEMAASNQLLHRMDTSYPMLFYSWGGNQPFSMINGFTPVILGGLDSFLQVFRRGEPGDGFVERSASKLGMNLGFYEQDHLNTANVFNSALGISAAFGKAQPLHLYCEHASRLAQAEIDYLNVGNLPSPRVPYTPGLNDPVRWYGVDQFGQPSRVTPPSQIYTMGLGSKPAQTTPVRDPNALVAPNVPWVIVKGIREPAISSRQRRSWEWQCLPGHNTPLRMNDTGEIEALSLDGLSPGVAKSAQQCKIIAELPPKADLIKPLVCGEPLKNKLGFTGYDKVGHWCEIAKGTLSDWQCRSTQGTRFGFFRKNSKGDIQGFSKNGTSLDEQNSFADCMQAINVRPSEAKILTCGDKMKAEMGTTGYDNPNHWCAKNIDIP